MQSKNKGLVEVYLSRNREDYIYNKCKEIIENTEVETFKKVSREYYGNWNNLKSALGTFKKYYIEGADLTDYYNNIITIVGRGDLENGKELFDNLILEVAKSIEQRLDIHITVREVKHILICLTLYKPYMGFLFEEMVRELLETNGFIVEESKELDYKYKIDLLVSLEDYKDYKIGLQLKADTYLKLSSYTKQIHLEGQQKAIRDAICKDVYYLVHNKLGQPLGELYNKDWICNNSRVAKNPYQNSLWNYEEEDIIEDITKEILMYYLTDNYKNVFGLGVTNVIIDKEYKKFLEKKKSLSILPIDKLN